MSWLWVYQSRVCVARLGSGVRGVVGMCKLGCTVKVMLVPADLSCSVVLKARRDFVTGAAFIPF
jgi:hypothetical protein